MEADRVLTEEQEVDLNHTTNDCEESWCFQRDVRNASWNSREWNPSPVFYRWKSFHVSPPFTKIALNSFLDLGYSTTEVLAVCVHSLFSWPDQVKTGTNILTSDSWSGLFTDENVTESRKWQYLTSEWNFPPSKKKPKKKTNKTKPENIFCEIFDKQCLFFGNENHFLLF